MNSNLHIRSIAVLTISFFCISILPAQPPKGHKPPPTPTPEQIVKMVDDMEKVLSLSKTQKEQILKIHNEHFEQLKKTEKGHNLSKEQAQKEHHKRRVAFENKIKQVLNKEQYTEYEKFIRARHQKKDKR